jgi:hypothetical protein
VRLTFDEFSAMFRTFERSAFRLESLQVYTVASEQPKLERFLAGEEKPIEPDSEWRKLISDSVAAGKVWTKVKIVRRPLTDYQRFSLAWGVPANEAAGEKHRIIDITDRAVDLPEIDYWLFDDTLVVVIHYHEDGSPDYIEQVESNDIEQYRRWREIALKESIPFSEYRA